ncbi:MAG: leucyl aminopeptidase [Actinobacteria bacterium]|nr:leucyl aminopeptidase [Actinomycetota bacterium]
MTSLSLSSSPAASAKVDAVVIGVAKGPKGLVLAPGSDSVASALGKGLLPALSGLGATGRAEEVTRLASLGATTAAVVVAVGLGDAPGKNGSYDDEVLRRATGAALRALAGSGKVAVTLAAAGPDVARQLRAVGEGALLGAYSFSRYRTTDSQERRDPVREVVLVVPDTKDKGLRAVVTRAEVVARAVHLARDLVNTPPSDLHPAELADVAKERAASVGVDVEVLEGKALAKGGFGGIIGVGQGSAHGPRLVHLSYKGGKGSSTKVALVGKGITFDSGGLSLKPAASMEEMKSDMGGAAAVIAAVAAVAELALAVDVEAWVPMAENMPSGTAIRPSDVLTLRGGTTVEVNNTDAEGRLILADAIARACEDGPDVVIDVATLTGAQLVALGSRTTGVMGNDDALRSAVVDAAGRAGEPSWPMPLPAELRKGLDSEVADLVNTGPREGGMLTAGLFLKEFVADGVRWAHLDIAGPAFNSGDAYGYTPQGGTGAAVRTFIQVLEDLAAERT